MKPILLIVLYVLTPAPAQAFEWVFTQPAETQLSNPDLKAPGPLWVEMIDSARTQLDISQAYVSSIPDEPMEPVIQAIERAGKRGVKVRILIEEKMLKACTPETIDLLKGMKGIDLRVLAFGKAGTGGIQHAKYFIVDKKSGYLGSQNFDWRSLKHIHEVGAKITEPNIIGKMQSIFEYDWKLQSHLNSAKPLPVQLNPGPYSTPNPTSELELVASPKGLNPTGIADSEAALVSLIGSAQKNLAIELLDYAPLTRDHKYYGVIDQALRAAQARGVSIRMMVSLWNTARPEVDYLKSLAVLPNIEIKLVQFPEPSTGHVPYARVIHAKTMVVDQKIAWMGTSNWTGGYLDQSRNLELIVRTQSHIDRELLLYNQLWDSAYAEPLKISFEYPTPKKD